MSHYSIVFGEPFHFGSHSDCFEDRAVYSVERLDPPPTYVGRSRCYQFNTTGVDGNEPAILMYQAFDVTMSTNVLELNGVALPGGIPVSAQRGEWRNNKTTIAPGILLPDEPNELCIRSAQTDDPSGEVYDNFVIAHVTVFFKIAE